ncbi:MAG: HlyD family efflux transporter periplasmic adaptor subunit [Dehalococcoidales bacterium]|nr:HlyD family efflux transporter periplasmic adaptor subunit [Dehalococcoidales bacterium]
MNLRRWFKLLSLILALVTVSFTWLSCRSGASPTATPTLVTVQRGNITTTITGSGNLAFSKTQDMAFGQSGQVAKINVQVGDNVTAGETLATLDTTDLQQAVDSANLSVQSAQISLTVAQNNASNIKDRDLAIQQSQNALVVAQNAQSSITSSLIDLQTASNSLAKISYPYTYSTFAFDVPSAIVAIHDAQLQLALASADLQPGSPNYGDALLKFNAALDSLTQAEQRLGRGVDITSLVKPSDNGTGPAGSNLWTTTDYWTLAAAQMALQKAQLTVDNAKNSYTSGLSGANLSLTQAQQALEEARNSYTTGLSQANVSLASAQNNLAKARRNLSEATITAPFTGIVTAVNISSGQLVGSGQVAIAIADPSKLEANVLVNEVDIPWVTEGGTATLQLDALSNLNLPASVTDVAPTASIQSGVVNYTVTIGLQSNVINPAQPGGASGNQTRGQGQNGPNGQTAQTRPGQTGGQAAGRPGGRAIQGSPASVVLRQGLSVTANIIKEQRSGVLLVPSRAIAQQGTSSYVQLVKDDGTIEQRIVQTGLTDGINTEIISGLAEGDKIYGQAKPATTTTTTTPAGGGFRPGGGGIRIGG